MGSQFQPLIMTMMIHYLECHLSPPDFCQFSKTETAFGSTFPTSTLQLYICYCICTFPMKESPCLTIIGNLVYPALAKVRSSGRQKIIRKTCFLSPAFTCFHLLCQALLLLTSLFSCFSLFRWNQLVPGPPAFESCQPNTAFSSLAVVLSPLISTQQTIHT